MSQVRIFKSSIVGSTFIFAAGKTITFSPTALGSFGVYETDEPSEIAEFERILGKQPNISEHIPEVAPEPKNPVPETQFKAQVQTAGQMLAQKAKEDAERLQKLKENGQNAGNVNAPVPNQTGAVLGGITTSADLGGNAADQAK